MNLRRISLVFTLLVAAVALAAHAQTNVFVPGTASGCFGNPNSCVPFVPAVSVTGAATITVTYVSGTVTDCCGIVAGPTGVPCALNVNGCTPDFQTPVQESLGIKPGPDNAMDALIGVFVLQSRVNEPGFTAIDGTKGAAPVGIMPNGLSFIGYGRTFSVTGAGTLFLGINDVDPTDNGGGFNVTVSVQ